jgi:uncharacterized protein
VVAYPDSSVVLGYVLLGEVAIRTVLEYPRLAASELLEIECRRVLQRCRLAQELDDSTYVAAVTRLEEVLASVDLLELSPAIKRRAMEAFPVTVKTLDALHLATALLLDHPDDSLIMFSHDEAVNRCARALGLTAPFATSPD